MSTLHVLGGGASQGLVESQRASFEAAEGCTVAGTFGAVGAMKQRLLDGAPADLLVLSRALVEELAQAGHVVPASVRDIGIVPTSVAVRAGDPAPSVASAADLKAALATADEVHFPDPQLATAGIHFARVLRELGLWDALAPRLRPAPNGNTAMRALAASTAPRPIGCTQATEILSTPGIVLAADLPPGCALATTYTCGIARRAANREAAEALVTRLTDAAGREDRRRLGFA
jgi:molybdate transport system substrate-binding protein